MKNSRLTIIDIARESGVSKSTVSRVLNGSEKVSPEAREAVLSVIRSTNYRPNVHARRTVTKTCNCIGLYIGSRVLIRHANSHVLSGVITKCNEAGFDLVICNEKRSHGMTEMYHERRVDGFLILNPYPQDAPMLQSLEDNGIPYFCTAVCADPERFRYVDTNNEQAAYDAVRYLIQCGHRSIALLCGSDAISSVDLRRIGYLRALREHGIEPNEELQIPIMRDSYSYDFTGLAQALHGENPPTACFATTDFHALQAINWLKEQGFRVPEDISMVGFDDLPDVLSDYPLTTVHQDFFARGYEACQRLLSLVQGGQSSSEHSFVAHRIVTRDTVRRIK